MHFDVRSPCDELVSQLRRQGSREHIVLSLMPPTADSVIVLTERPDHYRDIRWIILKICIQCDDDVAGCVINSSRKRGGLSKGVANLDNFDARIRHRKFAHCDVGAIRAAVIDKDDLE